MRRRQLTVGVVAIFLVWNAVTYFFITYSQPAKDADGRREFAEHVSELQKRLRRQAMEHSKILRELEEARNELFNVATNNVPSTVPREGKIFHQSVQHKATIPIPVLVMACNRPTVNRNLDQLLQYRPSAELFPIIVSQDCGHQPTADAIRAYGDKVRHIQHPDLSDMVLSKKDAKFKGYYLIARHYRWAINQVFHTFNYSAAIIVEDDLNVSPDFFEYFSATYPLLQADPTLWCVSAWNDNGKTNMIANDPELLYRTDFFPGLGWMLEKKTWLELEPVWPPTFWDDWMRHPDRRKDRACIRPEVPRTSTFGKIGVSKGQYFDKHLKFIEHNTKFVPFTERDLSYLLKDSYDDWFIKKVYQSPMATYNDLLSNTVTSDTIRVEYTDMNNFKTQAKAFGIMDDLRAGVPRSGYRGIVSFIFSKRRVYLAPPIDWRGYVTS